MDITRLNAEELFVIIFKEVGERVATILKDNEVNGQGLLQLNDEAKEVFPVLGDHLSVRAFIRRFSSSSSQVQQVSCL